MAYLALDKILEARSYVEENISKPDTFMGLVLFLLCVVERKSNGFYLKSDMKKFSEIADNAFYLSDTHASYSGKYWFGILANDWIDQVKSYFLKGNKVSANKVMQSIFWLNSFNDIKSKTSLIPNDIFDNIFINDLAESDFDQKIQIKKEELLSIYGGNSEALTIKFDSTFVKKKAGDLSGAPFAQTLYAGTEIKKIISVFDFDFIEKFSFSTTEEKLIINNRVDNKSIVELFKLWLLKQGLSEKTASSYSGAGIALCDKYIDKININVQSFYQLNSMQILDALQELGKVDDWVQANKNGNSMYSAACKKLAEFLAEKFCISGVQLPKPFLLLAGVSGTGKTRFVREQAKSSKQFTETYCLTSVRPDWHEPSDLLGYISRLNGSAEYITTDVLRFIAKAWCSIADRGLSIEVQHIEGQGDCLVVTGKLDSLDQVLPYWLCLDEMNLAPVEQYFADYLSVLETRKWQWTDDNFTYSSDALLKPATIKEVADQIKLRGSLGFGNSKYDGLWDFICQYGLGIPFNLMVAGTVNMDETTHGFSRKVIDRALSFDFGAFFPNDYDEFFTPTSCNKRLSYPIWSHANKEDLANTYDADGSKTIAFLSAVNSVLKNTSFELAFRALNELLLAVVCTQPKDELSLKAVWDDFMMCKVLPRIEGDIDKLTTMDGKALLEELGMILAVQLDPIWQADENNMLKLRPDLYREKLVSDGAADEEKLLTIPCRSKIKLKWMSNRLTSATFTSFWP